MNKNFAVIIHGGAGSVPKNYLDQHRDSYTDLLTNTISLGANLLSEGAQAADVAERLVKVLEDSDKFNAGKGSVLNTHGEVTMDASFCCGKSNTYGGVINVKSVKNAVSLARIVSQFKEHNLISGEDALELARENFLELKDMSYFITKYRKDQLEKAKKADSFCLDHFNGDAKLGNSEDDSKFGTVGAVVLDTFGNIAAATSTGGITNKKYGRVGDSPILGAGIWANNSTIGISCTGRGELFTEHLVAHDIHSRIKYGGESPEAACKHVVHTTLPPNSGGIIAIDRFGNVIAECNTDVMFHAYAVGNDNEIEQRVEIERQQKGE